MKVILDNGVTIEGTEERVKDTLTKMGFDGDGRYYFSNTKGLILISGMESTHLRNAILKFYKQWIDGLYNIKNPKEVVNKIVNGIDNSMWIAMVKELSERK